jgi:hypothetical protein
VIAEKELLVRDLVLIDGISRAGKFFLGRIVDGLERMEHFLVVDLVEIIPYLEGLGTIRKDAAVALLQYLVDAAVYDQRIGRNLNFRYADGSSIYECPDIERYLARCFSEDGERVIHETRSDKRISVFVTHEVLPNIGVFFDAFPRFRTIELLRHPVDLIYSWYKRGFGEREVRDPLSLSPFVKVSNRTVPWFASGWSAEYERLSRIDRVIRSIAAISEMGRASFKALPRARKNKVLFVRYEDVVEKTWQVVASLAKFLRTGPSRFMETILAREGCLRPLDPAGRERKRAEIKKAASADTFRLMMSLAEEYENGKS